MKEEYVPYEMAVELQKLGFDEPCIVSYVFMNSRGHAGYRLCGNWNAETDPFINSPGMIKCPSINGAFRWFRNKYGLDVNYDAYVSTAYTMKFHHLTDESLKYRGALMRRATIVMFDEKDQIELFALSVLMELAKEENSNNWNWIRDFIEKHKQIRTHENN